MCSRQLNWLSVCVLASPANWSSVCVFLHHRHRSGSYTRTSRVCSAPASILDVNCYGLDSRSVDLLGLHRGLLGLNSAAAGRLRSASRVLSRFSCHRVANSFISFMLYVGSTPSPLTVLAAAALTPLVGSSVFSSRVSSRFWVKSQGNRLNSRSARKMFSTTSTGCGFAVGCVLCRNVVGRRRRSPRARARLHAFAPTHIELALFRTSPP